MQVILITIVCSFLLYGVRGYHVVCVYTNWSQYRPDGGKFLPEDIDPDLCTHIIYAYAKLRANRLIAAEWNDEGTRWRDGMFDRVNNVKQMNPELKTLLGVGGWMMGSKDFSKLAASRMARRLFARSTVKFLRDRNFDGLSIDWQHPTKRGGRRQDKMNFPLLLQEIRREFHKESVKTGNPTLLLVVGVSASKDVINSGYDVPNITKHVDLLNVMAYDLHGPWDNYTGHQSQLYARQEELGPVSQINVDSAMKYWLSKGADRSKLLLGISSYGRTFTLSDPLHTDLMVPTSGPGLPGEYTQQEGMLAYYERCSQYFDATRVWDNDSKATYWVKGDQWISGEDVDSVKAKVNWAKRYRAGGVTVWSLDTDDYAANCASAQYPLLSAIKAELENPSLNTSLLKPESTETTTLDPLFDAMNDVLSESQLQETKVTPNAPITQKKQTSPVVKQLNRGGAGHKSQSIKNNNEKQTAKDSNRTQQSPKEVFDAKNRTSKSTAKGLSNKPNISFKVTGSFNDKNTKHNSVSNNKQLTTSEQETVSISKNESNVTNKTHKEHSISDKPVQQIVNATVVTTTLKPKSTPRPGNNKRKKKTKRNNNKMRQKWLKRRRLQRMRWQKRKKARQQNQKNTKQKLNQSNKKEKQPGKTKATDSKISTADKDTKQIPIQSGQNNDATKNPSNSTENAAHKSHVPTRVALKHPHEPNSASQANGHIAIHKLPAGNNNNGDSPTYDNKGNHAQSNSKTNSVTGLENESSGQNTRTHGDSMRSDTNTSIPLTSETVTINGKKTKPLLNNETIISLQKPVKPQKVSRQKTAANVKNTSHEKINAANSNKVHKIVKPRKIRKRKRPTQKLTRQQRIHRRNQRRKQMLKRQQKLQQKQNKTNIS